MPGATGVGDGTGAERARAAHSRDRREGEQVFTMRADELTSGS